MKQFISYTTILSYSIFAFVFAAACPIVCISYGQQKACAMICEQNQEETGMCSSQSCDRSCPNVDPLAICSGAYGTQNSLRTLCKCPAPDKTPLTAGIARFSNDLDQPIQPQPAAVPPESPSLRDLEFESPTAMFIANIISVSVIRV